MFISVYDPNHQLFILNFRGLSFSFPIDSKFEVCYLHAIDKVRPEVLILRTEGERTVRFLHCITTTTTLTTPTTKLY